MSLERNLIAVKENVKIDTDSKKYDGLHRCVCGFCSAGKLPIG